MLGGRREAGQAGEGMKSLYRKVDSFDGQTITINGKPSYELGSFLGGGAAGVVYEVRHPIISAFVFLKRSRSCFAIWRQAFGNLPYTRSKLYYLRGRPDCRRYVGEELTYVRKRTASTFLLPSKLPKEWEG